MYTAHLDFDKDFDNLLIAELTDKNLHIDETGNSEKLRMRYFNYKRRSIYEIPREVLISKEFSCPPEYQTGLENVKNKFENGESLLPHLSKELINLDYNDSLLNDWKIYHLHLGSEFEENGSGFIKRTGPLLFARVEDDKVYFINVMPHTDSWTKQEMIKIIHNNWPESIEMYRLKDVIGLEHIPTDDDIKVMRKFGVNSSIEIEPGIVYMSIGLGQTTAKTSMEVAMVISQYSRLIPKLQSLVENNLQKIGELISADANIEGNELFLKLVIQDGQYYALEQKTGIAIDLGKH